MWSLSWQSMYFVTQQVVNLVGDMVVSFIQNNDRISTLINEDVFTSFYFNHHFTNIEEWLVAYKNHGRKILDFTIKKYNNFQVEWPTNIIITSQKNISVDENLRKLETENILLIFLFLKCWAFTSCCSFRKEIGSLPQLNLPENNIAPTANVCNSKIIYPFILHSLIPTLLLDLNQFFELKSKIS